MSGRRVRQLAVVAALSAIGGAVAVRSSANRETRPLPRRLMTRDAFYRVRTQRHLIALTFDDGPDPSVTPQVLMLLAKYHAHATFFLVGRHLLAHPSLVRDEVAAGDELGNHTWDHPRLTSLTGPLVESELARTDAAFEQLGLPKPALFRPPFGVASRLVLARAVALGHRMVLWSLAVDHFLEHESIERSEAALIGRVQPGDIILAHDCCPPHDRTRTVRLLELLLPALEARGYQVVTVSGLLTAGSV